jgi:quercetin dioxygenase-like cupin family protein
MSNFFSDSEKPGWEQVNKGLRRKILAYDRTIMMVMVEFDENTVAPAHKHRHNQCTCVLSGIFEVTIGPETNVLQEGDSFVVPENEMHGVVCRKAGRLLDAFSPAREDFLNP